MDRQTPENRFWPAGLVKATVVVAVPRHAEKIPSYRRFSRAWIPLLSIILIILSASDGRAQRLTGHIIPATLPASERPVNSLLGAKVAIRGDWAFIGSLWGEAVYVFHFNGSWNYFQTLTGEGSKASPALFGTSIAVSDDTIPVVVVGAPSEDHLAVNDNRGAAYIFHYDSGVNRFIRVKRITAPDATNESRFGSSVAILGNHGVFAAAALGGPGGKGAVYSFIRSAGFTWTYVSQLAAPTGMSSYGGSLDAASTPDGHWLMVGAPATVNLPGAVEMVSLNPFNLAVLGRQPIGAPRAQAGDQFGFSVAIHYYGAVIGAPGSDVSLRAREGVAYVLTNSGGKWAIQQTLVTPVTPWSAGGKSGDGFGWSVDLEYGSWVLVGSPNFGRDGQFGAVLSFVYDHSEGAWVWGNTAVDYEYADNEFGTSVSTDGRQLIVGARFDDNDGQPSNGSARIFLQEWLVKVQLAGSGKGTVTSNPAGFDCSATFAACSQIFTTRSSVNLTATPAADSVFAGWSGDCTYGSSLYVDRPHSCTASFALKSQAGNARSDFNGDGKMDLLWQNVKDGYLATWTMNGPNLIASELLDPPYVSDANWKIVGTGDFNGDNKPDIVWQEQTEGWIGIWLMNGTSLLSSTTLSPSNRERVADINWKIVGLMDLNGDGKTDILWRERTQGWLAAWLCDGLSVTGSVGLNPERVPDVNWEIMANADMNGDGKADIIWQNKADGYLAVWYMNGLSIFDSVLMKPAYVTDTNWKIVAAGDLNGDGKADLIWQEQTEGWIGAWLMNGISLLSSQAISPERVADTNWKIVGPK